VSNSYEVLIKANNVLKKFCRSLKRSMLYGIEDISRDLVHLPNTSDKLRRDEFWAINKNKKFMPTSCCTKAKMQR